MARNLELKVAATLDQLDIVATRLKTRALANEFELRQTDTYYRVPHGRLKLRLIADTAENSAELIQYDRPDIAGSRLSQYRLLPLDAAQSESITEMLADAIGVLTTIRKHRRVAISGATRVHLDQVEGLGCFIELETVLAEEDSDGSVGRAEYNDVVEWLGLASMTAVPGSYSDLMIQKGNRG